MSETENLAPAFALVLACRLLAVAAITMMRYRRPDRPSQTISWQSVVAGIRFVWNTKLILATITLDLFAVLLGGATYLLPIYRQGHPRRWPDRPGIAPLGRRRRRRLHGHDCWPTGRRCAAPASTMLWAVAGFGVATIIFGLSQWFWLSLVMMFLVGALDNISVVVRHTLVQMLTPDEMRGRVSAVNSVFIVASQRSRRTGVGLDGVAVRSRHLGGRRRRRHDPRRAGA